MSNDKEKRSKYPHSASVELENAILESVEEGLIFDFDEWRRDETQSLEARIAGNNVDARFLCDLCLERPLKPKGDDCGYKTVVHAIGVRVRGLSILGDVELNDHTIPKPIALDDCIIDGRVLLRDAITKGIRLYHTKMKSLNANGSSINGRFRLEKAAVLRGVDLRHTKINGELNCCDATFVNCCMANDDASSEKNVGNGREYSAPSIAGLDATGIQVKGDFVANGLLVEGKAGLNLNGAKIRGDLSANNARLRSICTTIQMSGPSDQSEINQYGLSADRLIVVGRLDFNDATFFGNRAVRLGGAKVGGHANFRRITATSSGNAFTSDGSTFRGDLKIGGIITSTLKDAIRLRHAKVLGNLSLGHRGRQTASDKVTTKKNEDTADVSLIANQYAFIADGISVSGRLLVRGSLISQNYDAIRVHGAKLHGPLDISCATLCARLDGLAAERCSFGSFVEIDDSTIISGVRGVSLSDSKVEGGFTCRRSRIQGGNDHLRRGWIGDVASGVRADRLHVSGEVIIEDCGKAVIGERGQISGPEAFRARGAIFESSVSFRGSRLVQSKCSGGASAYRDFTALDLSHAIVKGVLLLDKKAGPQDQEDADSSADYPRATSVPIFKGNIRLDRATIDTLADHKETWFGSSDQAPVGWLNKARNWIAQATRNKSTIQQSAAERPVKTPGNESTIQTIVLDGFRYNHLREPGAVAFRIQLLKRQPTKHLSDNFRPDPWEQLARVLREMGHPLWAKTILIEKNKLVGKQRKARWDKLERNWGKTSDSTSNGIWDRVSHIVELLVVRTGHGFIRWVAGYGYSPFRPLLFLLMLYVATWGILEKADTAGLMSPSQAAANVYAMGAAQRLISSDVGGENIDSSNSTAASNAAPGKTIQHNNNKTASVNAPTYADLVVPGYPKFHAALYAADIVIPLINLHQEDFWEPAAPNCDSFLKAPATETHHKNGVCVIDVADLFRRFVEAWRAFAIIAGWILASISIAGLTGLMRSERS